MCPNRALNPQVGTHRRRRILSSGLNTSILGYLDIKEQISRKTLRYYSRITLKCSHLNQFAYYLPVSGSGVQFSSSGYSGPGSSRSFIKVLAGPVVSPNWEDPSRFITRLWAGAVLMSCQPGAAF